MRPDESWSSALAALRSGDLDFDQFARTHRDRFERWGGYFHARWPQNQLSVEDLAQEAMIECWRAVDIWDPTRSSLVAFVNFRVGRKLRVELERVLGWPKKSAHWDSWLSAQWIDADESPDLVVAGDDPERRSMVRDAARAIPPEVPMMEDVVRGVGAGMPLPVVAQRLWDDLNRRCMYGLESQDQTLRAVTTMARSAPRFIERKRRRGTYHR